MLVRLLTMLMSSLGVLLRLFVLADFMVMGRLMMMMGGSVMMGGRLEMMLAGRVLGLCHGALPPKRTENPDPGYSFDAVKSSFGSNSARG